MGRMSELDIEMTEEFSILTEEEFIRQYGEANYIYYQDMLDPDIKEEDMPEKNHHATACTEWTKLDQQIHDKDWEEWNKTIT